jgi:hypothetical protein
MATQNLSIAFEVETKCNRNHRMHILYNCLTKILSRFQSTNLCPHWVVEEDSLGVGGGRGE